MSNPISTTDLKLRLAALQQEACAQAGQVCTTYPRWNVSSEGYPYWINKIMRVTADTAPGDDGEEMAVYVYTLCGRFVVGQLTGDTLGNADTLIDTLLPQIISYIDQRTWLQSASFTTAMPFLRECHYYDGTGYGVFPLSVAGVQQVGCDLYWRATFEQQLEQAFLG